MASPGTSLHSTAVALATENLGRIVPFYILVDTAGTVRSVGPALAKIIPAEQLVDRPVFDALTITKPRRLDREKGLRDVLGEKLTIAIPHLKAQGSNSLFGMALPAEWAGQNHILVALTPGVNARAFVQDHGLKLSDFGPADGSADILPLLAMQADMLEDSKKKSAKLLRARDAAERMANRDTLTDLPNRRAFMQGLSEALTLGPVAVAHVDLDKFKEINDMHGHAAGDAALKHAAHAFQRVFGQNALCARIGGDEFVGMLEGTWSDSALKDIAKAVILQISEPFQFAGETLRAGASVGLATATPEDGLSADNLLHRADLALYEVKRTGRSNARLCTPDLLVAHNEFQALSADIRRGLAEYEFIAYLQPQVEARTGAVIGFEALARWAHPKHGLLSPAQFLEATNRAGLIQDLDGQVRRAALNALAIWDAQGIEVPKISLNVTIRDLLDPEYRQILLWDLEARDLDTTRIAIEIVESVFYEEQSTEIAQACQSLVDAGLILALDDFGTGHASILSLVNLPMSIVKIDRAFTTGVAADPRKKALAQSMISIATTLGLEVLAEGADNDADVAVLCELGCEYFQSYHFGRPMAPEDALNWLANRPLRPIPYEGDDAHSADENRKSA